MNVALVGHSFVSQWERKLRGSYGWQCHFDREVAGHLSVSKIVSNVFLLGRGGARQQMPYLPITTLKLISPDVTILDLGTNDLANISYTIEEAAQWVLDQAIEIRNKVHGLVYVCSVVPRTGNLRGMSEVMFFQRMEQYNRLLEHMVQNEQGIYFHRHKGFYEGRQGKARTRLPVHTWSQDGIHPDDFEGDRKYSNSIKSAIYAAHNKIVG